MLGFFLFIFFNLGNWLRGALGCMWDLFSLCGGICWDLDLWHADSSLQNVGQTWALLPLGQPCLCPWTREVPHLASDLGFDSGFNCSRKVKSLGLVDRFWEIVERGRTRSNRFPKRFIPGKQFFWLNGESCLSFELF